MMSGHLEIFARKTGLKDQVEKAVLSGANEADLFWFVVDLNRQNMQTAKRVMIDTLIERRVVEQLRREEETIQQDIEMLLKRIPDHDQERQKLVIDLSIKLARKRIEDKIRHNSACDIQNIIEDYRF